MTGPLKRLFTDHPHEVGEGYVQHLVQAWSFGFRLLRLSGAAFLHGAAVTIHKAQGSQWPQVQVFAPDIAAAAWSNRNEAGVPLWKRLTYVAITRAQERLFWVTKARLARPAAGLSTADLEAPASALALSAAEAED